MSTDRNIENAYVQAFYDDVCYLLEQEDSRVAGKCARVETATAETHNFERFGGELEMVAKTRNSF